MKIAELVYIRKTDLTYALEKGVCHLFGGVPADSVFMRKFPTAEAQCQHFSRKVEYCDKIDSFRDSSFEYQIIQAVQQILRIKGLEPKVPQFKRNRITRSTSSFTASSLSI